jgi:hypothetical protein
VGGSHTGENNEDELSNEETGIIPPVTPKEVERIIRQQINPNKHQAMT